MIVILNDETTDSEWCLYEWEYAREMELPIKVIVDMERFSKKAALALLSDKYDFSAPPTPHCTAKKPERELPLQYSLLPCAHNHGRRPILFRGSAQPSTVGIHREAPSRLSC
jgi:hypothetical protein